MPLAILNNRARRFRPDLLLRKFYQPLFKSVP